MRKAMYLMGALEDSDIEWLAANGTALHLSQGQVLVREGQPVDSLFVVLDGQLAVQAGGARGAGGNLVRGFSTAAGHRDGGRCGARSSGAPGSAANQARLRFEIRGQLLPRFGDLSRRPPARDDYAHGLRTAGAGRRGGGCRRAQ